MRVGHRSGFSLLETIVALTLFAGVLLSMLGAGQFILASLFESDQRLRASVFTQSIIDSLRGTACARLASGAATQGALTATWSVTDLVDAARIDLTSTLPRRGVAPTIQRTTVLLSCPEP
jgi:prepilin-type N-terminal cleavage/methylation domain-containing protein